MELEDALIRIEELEEENRTLRSELVGPSERIAALINAYKFRPHEAKIVNAMLGRDMATTRTLDCALEYDMRDDPPDTNVFKVHMCRIRKKMPDWARPQTVWGLGYRILPEAQKRILQEIGHADAV